jgi:hypothetical protein
MNILYPQGKKDGNGHAITLDFISESCQSQELFDISMRFSQENKSVVMEGKIKSQSH